MPRPLYPRGRDPVPLVQETEWVYGAILTGVENPAVSGPRYPTSLARSETLYRLSYPGRLAVHRNSLFLSGRTFIAYLAVEFEPAESTPYPHIIFQSLISYYLPNACAL
jgi:hypothetical protein